MTHSVPAGAANPALCLDPHQEQVSLIIPVYNEEENLRVLAKEITAAMGRQKRSWRALFIDDGSTDASLAVLRAIASEDARFFYLSFAENCGQSAALAAGFGEAPGEIFVTLDADLQNDPADIPAMLNLYEQGHDMVAGWRANRQDSRLKLLSSKFANAVRNFLSGEAVRDTGCSLKIMRAEIARSIPMFKGMHRFLPTLMKMRGAKVVEMKVSHRPRLHGSSKYGILDRAFVTFYDLLAIRWMQRRMFTYQIKERKQP